MCTPPCTTIAHLWIPLVSELALKYYGWNKD